VVEVVEGPVLLVATIIMGGGGGGNAVNHDLDLVTDIGMVTGQEGPEVEVEAEIVEMSLSIEVGIGIVERIEMGIMEDEKEFRIKIVVSMALFMEMEATGEVIIETMIVGAVVIEGGLVLDLLEEEEVAVEMFGMCFEKDLWHHQEETQITETITRY
jgi:hypothetical protein